MKKLNIFQKYALKYTDKETYKRYKHVQRTEAAEHVFMQYAAKVNIVEKDFYHFKHSGNIGDIIYALPTMIGLSGSAKFNLYMNLNRPNHFKELHMRHPLGDVMLNEKMVEMIRPLLQYQPYCKDCIVYKDQPIDYDLDEVRESPMILEKLNGARWYMLLYPVAYDLNKVWIDAPMQTGLEDAIVLARSSRYHTPGLDYSFLKKYSRIFFVGIEEEYKEMHQLIPHLQYLPVSNFLELAGYIGGAKLFIGNQSFPFSLAEAMKVNRLLELSYYVPTVNVYGDQGFDFLFQPQFEYLVKKRYEEL